MTKTIDVELACEGLKDAVSTWEQVSDVLPCANRRTAKELKSLRLKKARIHTSICFAFVIMLLFGGLRDFELRIC